MTIDRKVHTIRSSCPHRGRLTTLALLDSQGSLLVLTIASTQVVNLLGTVITLDAKRGLAVEGKLSLLVNAEGVQVGALGGGTGVRDGQGNGFVGLLDGVQVLPAGGSLTLGRVGHLGALRTAVDYTYGSIQRRD